MVTFFELCKREAKNCIVKTFAFCLLMAFSSATAAIWDGTANTEWFNSGQDSFTISTAEELAGLAQLVNGGNNFKGKTITLAADIMLNDTTDWKSWDDKTAGLNTWIPIGDNPIDAVSNKIYFEGTFDGAGHLIFGLYIYAGHKDNQGLFGITGSESIVKNTGVFAYYIKSTSFYAGVLIANNEGVVENCYSNNGSVIGLRYVGGVIGSNSGTVKNSYSNRTVVIVGTGSNVGGVVGINSGAVDNCYSMSTVGSKDGYAGGVVGYNLLGTVSNSYFIGEMGSGGFCGGVVGVNSGTVSNSYSTANIGEERGREIGEIIIPSYPRRSGGVVGWNRENGTVKACYSTGSVNGLENIGGVVGYNEGAVLNCYSTGWIYYGGFTSDAMVGGIVGYDYINSFYGFGIGYTDTNIIVRNCAALNPGIYSGNYFGRITSYLFDDVSTYSGNKAFNGMNIIPKTPKKGHDKEDGEDITAASIRADGTIGGLFTEENGWTVENGKLPGLFGKAVDMPEHLKNSSPIQNTIAYTPAIKIWLNGTESFKIQGLGKSERIRMFNLNGSILLDGTIQPNENISISHLPRGVYFVNVEGKILKFVK